jgi:hypothetical protein
MGQMGPHPNLVGSAIADLGSTCDESVRKSGPYKHRHFGTPDGVPRVRAGAEQFFGTHFEQLKMAAGVCPVDVIVLETSDA